ncbi:TRAP transporter large permease [Tuberibacillus sp. Marseille-P3662]|uniref:TRAP transporter large permease n=1 Tax=Tuberibacillus sp. Marseille-P3662 TaxID=1965358 RepID=UPI000A1CD144|nr:TRAP transporter large permease [Tuberibacillus sp. Marseille-P3662]
MILLIIAILLFLIILGMPISFALGTSSLVYLLIEGYDLSMVTQSIVGGVNSFTILAVPFFLMVGELMNFGGITDRIIRMARVLVGHFKGGLAQVNILASLFFSGISGSATADTVALGSVLIPSMKKEGYDDRFAAAITAASSIVGPIIPPSITLIIFGITTQQPIGPLLMAGIVPGVMIALSLMVYTYFVSAKRGYPQYPRATFREGRKAFGQGIAALLMPLIIIGGVLSGVFTATESAAVAVFYGIVIGVFYYRNIDLKGFVGIVKRSSVESANILFVLASASIFAWVVTRARISTVVADFVLGFSTNPTIIMILLILFLLLIGLFMLPSEAILVFAPILTPLAAQVGVNPIHFGVLMVLTLTIGGATPPVGILLYIVADIGKVPFMKLVRSMGPFYIPLLIAVLITAFIPQLTMYIPNLFFLE